MTDDRWTRSALVDNTVVAQLLLRLKHSCTDYSYHNGLIPFEVNWGHRQPRSKQPSTTTTSSAAATTTPVTITTTADCYLMKKERERCSPTTPLSWSGASSTSDESSRPSDLNRSMAVESATADKKSRKRKSFSELKEEEDFLLKERTDLKKEIATMQLTFKQQIATSANLKRFKHGMHAQSGSNVERRLNSFKATNVETQERGGRGFVVPDLNDLPDLNMSPTEE